jgi:RNA polymerase sigma-70 factor (sigma-E family)
VIVASSEHGPGAGADGRDAAFERYVASRQHALLRTAVLLTGGDVATAEDLLQTALSRLYLAWHRIERDTALDAYVRRIMVNQYTSWWRRAWRRRETSTDPIDLPAPRSPGSAWPRLDDEVAERATVWALVQMLPPRQRATVVLRFYEDLSEAQTAEVLGCSVGTVKAASSRAVARLRLLHAEEARS